MSSLRFATGIAILAAGAIACGFSCNDNNPNQTAPSLEFPPKAAGGSNSATDGCGSIAITGKPSVHPGATNVFSASITGTCQTPSIQWSIANGPCKIEGSDTASTVNIVGDTVGSCTISSSLTCAGCTSSSVTSSTQISVAAAPDCTITADPPCPGSTGNTACVPDSGPTATYSWTVTGGTITAGQGTRCITYTAAASGTVNLGVIVSITACQPCQASREFVLAPSLTCTIASASLLGSFTGTVSGGTGPFTCLATIDQAGWVIDGCTVDNSGNGPGFTVTYHSTTGTCNPVAAPLVSATITDANGCTTQCSQSVPCPPGGCTISGPSFICDGESATLCATPSTGTIPPGTVTWSGPNGFTNTSQCITVTTPGVYTANVTDEAGAQSVCCAPLELVTIEGPVAPCPPVTGLTYSAVVTSTDATFSGTYAWTISGDATFTGGSTSATGNPVSVDFTGPGSFTLTVTPTGLLTFACEGSQTSSPATHGCQSTVAAGPCGGGGQACTPGYWKQTQHFQAWCDAGYQPVDDFCPSLGSATLFKDAFNLTDFTSADIPAGFDSSRTLFEAVAVSPPGGCFNQTLFQGSAALLDAAAIPTFGHSVAEVQAIMQQAFAGTISFCTAAETFANWIDTNEKAGGCPCDNDGCHITASAGVNTDRDSEAPARLNNTQTFCGAVSGAGMLPFLIAGWTIIRRKKAGE